MKRNLLAALLILSSAVSAQRGRRTGQPTTATGAYNLPAVTFRGELKEITGKAVTLLAEDGQQVTLYRNHKTRFLRGTEAVQAKQILPGSKLTVDVAKNPDGSLLALNVIMDK